MTQTAGLKRTLVAMIARHVVNHAGLLGSQRPDISWTTYAASGGRILRKRP